MKEQGFEYRPYSYARERVRFEAMVGLSADPQAFASTYGYGITAARLGGPAR